MKKEIPFVNEINLRDNPNSNKFIQIYVNEKPYFRFIRKDDTRYHFDILANTLIDEFKMPFPSERGIPLRRGRGYHLVGAGKFEVGENEKITLYGVSIDYLVGPNRKHAEEISKLTGLEFIIRD
jgi:hypothetical protein